MTSMWPEPQDHLAMGAAPCDAPRRRCAGCLGCACCSAPQASATDGTPDRFVSRPGSGGVLRAGIRVDGEWCRCDGRASGQRCGWVVSKEAKGAARSSPLSCKTALCHLQARPLGRSMLAVALMFAVCVDVACGLAASPCIRSCHMRSSGLVASKMSTTNSVGSFVDSAPAGRTAFAIAWEKAQKRAHSKDQRQLCLASAASGLQEKVSTVAFADHDQESSVRTEGHEDSGGAFVHHKLAGVWADWLNENCPQDLTSALAGLTDESASQRKAAVARLLSRLPCEHSQAGPAQKHWAWAALAAHLNDDSAAVRKAAVKGLAAISEKGNRNVVLAMADLIEEEKAITVRTAALQALTRVAQRGDVEALAPVLNLLQRVEGVERGDVFSPKLSSGIKEQAVKALSTLADPGNEGAIKALTKRIMDDPKPEVREAAIRGLASIACPSSPHVIWALSISCEDEDENVRRTASRNLRLLLKRQEAKQVLQDAAAGPRPAKCSEGDVDDADSHARVYWLLPGIWGA